jgi:hypothetical protein
MVEVYWRFGRTYCLHFQGDRQNACCLFVHSYSFILNIEAARALETSINYQTTRNHISQYKIVMVTTVGPQISDC